MENLQIRQTVELLKRILGQDLLGVYLYGSSIVGGLQKYSDLDLFVVSERPTTADEKKEIDKELLSISGIYKVSKNLLPIELTIVVKSDINPWKYPPLFDFQYGEWLREDIEKGTAQPLENREMPDLALLITQILLASKTVYVSDVKDLLPQVPFDDILRATDHEMSPLLADLPWDTRNVLLTLARRWYRLETDTISSKPTAAKWAIDKLPQEYKPAVEKAMRIANGEEPDEWDEIETVVKPSAEFMVKKIEKRMAILKSSDNSTRVLKLAY